MGQLVNQILNTVEKLIEMSNASIPLTWEKKDIQSPSRGRITQLFWLSIRVNLKTND